LQPANLLPSTCTESGRSASASRCRKYAARGDKLTAARVACPLWTHISCTCKRRRPAQTRCRWAAASLLAARGQTARAADSLCQPEGLLAAQHAQQRCCKALADSPDSRTGATVHRAGQRCS
jgi:hypothetical protein